MATVTPPADWTSASSRVSTINASSTKHKTGTKYQLLLSVDQQQQKQQEQQGESFVGETGSPNPKRLLLSPQDPNVLLYDRNTLATVLTQRISALTRDDATTLVSFEGDEMPPISLHDYVERLIRYADLWSDDDSKGERHSLGSVHAIVALEYLCRLREPFSIRAAHRLFATAFLIAIKFNDDCKVSNRFWSRVAGLETDEMNGFEVNLSQVLQWRFDVAPWQFSDQIGICSKLCQMNLSVNPA